ncbi:UNVERIFIED_CONTAM: stage III sporulation protein AF [Acetivibrio alkalicellulosi]
MIGFLKDWVLNIVTLAIFIILIEILIPSGKMKKTVNLFTGLILVIALINPVLSILKKEIDFSALNIENNYMYIGEIDINSNNLKESQITQMTSVYRGKVISQIESIAKEEGVVDAKADVIINEDFYDENFGEIMRVYLYLNMYEKTKEIKPILSVERVRIGNDSLEEDLKVENPYNNKIKEKIENKIGEIFGTQKENIVISFEEN